MKPSTIIMLNIQAYNGLVVSFKGLFGLGSEILTHRAVVPADFNGTVHDAMVLLLRSIECHSTNKDLTERANALLDDVVNKLVEEKLACTFNANRHAGVACFSVNMEVMSSLDGPVGDFNRNQPLPWGGKVFDPILCRTEQRTYDGTVPAQMQSTMGRAIYGGSARNYNDTPHMRNVYEMLGDYFKGLPSFGGLERDTLPRIGRTQGSYNALAQEFETFKNCNRDSFSRVHAMLETFFNIDPQLSLDGFVNDFHGFVESVLKNHYSEPAAQHFTLAFINACDRLKKTPSVMLPLEEKDYREEAELVLFNTFATMSLGMGSLSAYDPRDVWEDALKACPPVTEFGRRSLGLEGAGNEINDPAWDAELLEEVLSTPHTTPAAAAAALYVLDVLGRGLPTPVLLEALPSTFVQDFSDYCSALGGEGPFGFTQLNAIKETLINRWFITYDSALGVLRTQLDPLGFDVKDPAVARKLELAASSLMKDRTLLFVDSIEE